MKENGIFEKFIIEIFLPLHSKTNKPKEIKPLAQIHRIFKWFGDVCLLFKVFVSLFNIAVIFPKIFCSLLRLSYECKNYQGPSFYFLAKYIMSKDNFCNWGLELDCNSEI